MGNGQQSQKKMTAESEEGGVLESPVRRVSQGEGCDQLSHALRRWMATLLAAAMVTVTAYLTVSLISWTVRDNFPSFLKKKIFIHLFSGWLP